MSVHRRSKCIAFMAVAICSFAWGQTPHIDPANDAAHLGDPQRFLFWSDPQRIAGFRNIDALFPTRPVRAGSYTLALPVARRDFSGLTYRVDNASFSFADYLTRNNVVGLLVLKDGNIHHELYTSGNNQGSLWVSFSMAKSVTAMLIGAAIKDGYIQSVDEKVTAYLPRLAGTSYDAVSIRNVLQMASGVQWDETYDDPESDVNTAPRDYLGLAQTLARKPRLAPPGSQFTYNTGETNLAGAILRAAIGNNAATYLQAKIWQPFGMEADANWMLDAPAGGELGGCCLNITLRDYGRLGLYAMGGGRLADGTATLPDGWMVESTSPSPAADFYGYLWWLVDPPAYMALGIFGQSIYINPAKQLVIVTLSSWDTAVGDEYQAHRTAFLQALDAAYPLP